MRRGLVSAFAVVAIASLAWAEELPSGDAVVERINAREEGQSLSRKLVMELIDKRGKSRVRETRTYRKYFGADKKTAIFYLEPKNIRGTAFLTFDYADAAEDDDQWIYLPALRKSRRISATDRGDAFLGTDFTYDDIKNETKVNAGDYTWQTVGEAEVDGHPCVIVEATPVDERVARELGYSKVRSWVDREIWMVRQSEYWDRKKKKLKTVKVADIRQVEGIWTPHGVDAENHRTGHRTRFEFSENDYATDLEESLFTERRLRKGL